MARMINVTYSLDSHVSGTRTPIQKIDTHTRLIHQGNHLSVFNGLAKTNLLSRDQPSRIQIFHLLQGTFKRVINDRVTFL